MSHAENEVEIIADQDSCLGKLVLMSVYLGHTLLLREWYCRRYSHQAAIVAERRAGHEMIDSEGWFTFIKILIQSHWFVSCGVTSTVVSLVPELNYI